MPEVIRAVELEIDSTAAASLPDVALAGPSLTAFPPLSHFFPHLPAKI
jgi:hypothetical protein